MDESAQVDTEVNVHIQSTTHKNTLLTRLEDQRKNNFLCDITMIVENDKFRAHKAVLAASSEYFSAMFAAEENVGQSVCVMEGMVPETFGWLLQFLYTGSVQVNKNCLQQIVATAKALKVDDFLKAHSEYLKEQRIVTPARRSATVTLGVHNGDLPKRKRGRPKKIMHVLDCMEVIVDSEDMLTSEGSSVPEKKSSKEKETSSRVSNGKSAHCEEVILSDSGDEFIVEDYHEISSAEDEEVIVKQPVKRRPRTPLKLQDYTVTVNIEEGEIVKPAGTKKRKRYTSGVQCKDCGKVFRYNHFLAVHQRTHTGERPFMCAECGKGFSQKHSLIVHERMHTGEKPFSCSICNKALATKNSLTEHMNLHEATKLFTCDQCGKYFSQKRQLRSHYRIHTGSALPECIVCHHKFMDTAQLKKHMRSHTGEKPFTCEVCGKSFTAKSSLKTHSRIHRGEKPFTCDICGKSFSDASARRRHCSSHNGNKPFSCPECNALFSRLDNLKSHLKGTCKGVQIAIIAGVKEVKTNSGGARKARNISAAVDQVRNIPEEVEEVRNITKTVEDIRNTPEAAVGVKNTPEATEGVKNNSEAGGEVKNIAEAVVEGGNIAEVVEEGRNISEAVEEERNISEAVEEERNISEAVEEGANMSEVEGRNISEAVDGVTRISEAVIKGNNISKVQEDRTNMSEEVEVRNVSEVVEVGSSISEVVDEVRHISEVVEEVRHISDGEEEVRSLIQLQTCDMTGQEIQLLVTNGVHHLDFTSGHIQATCIVPSDTTQTITAQSAKLTLISHDPATLHTLPLTAHQTHVEPIHSIRLVESTVQTVQSEQMHVITLSKEALDQLHGVTQEIHVSQADGQIPLTQEEEAQPSSEIMNQSAQDADNAQPALSVNPISQPLSESESKEQTLKEQDNTVTFISPTLETSQT
ncbi:zinc finger and BTB domain-containing protein 24 [Discoglossus pictus]